MRKSISRLAGALAVAALAAACTGKGESASADTALGKDLQMAGGSTAAQPSLADTAMAPGAKAAPAKPAAGAARTPATRPAEPKAAAKPEPARPAGEVAEGTSLVIHPSERVCTNTHKVGQIVSATVADPVDGTNGVRIPAGAVVKLEIVALKRSENVKDPIDMGFKVQSVTFDGRTYEMAAAVTKETIERVRNEPKEKDVQKVVGGAVIGAIAGKILGKSDKGAVVGAAAGAAAGAGVAATTANYEGCIAQGSDMLVKLTAPVIIR
ncbi:MAG: hypothetical protein KGL38_11610 [Gemmatimonadota bacterium]|nr:hypothetical protein [Gemmatimonadota bacterium]